VTDKQGNELAIGDTVDVPVDGIMSAVVSQIQEGGLVGPDGKPQPALLVLTIPIPMRLAPGQPAPVYLTRKAEKPQQKEKVH